MSFIGRSAEEVYRYALRRDRDGRSLSDGFGFSIVFINDESPVSAQFLLDYFKQLSHRTSNRVRFIFFGEMTEAETIERQTRGARLGDLERVVDAVNRLAPIERFQEIVARREQRDGARGAGLS